MLRDFTQVLTCKAVLTDYVTIGLWKHPNFEGNLFPHAYFSFLTEEVNIGGKKQRHDLRTKYFKCFSRPGERSTIYKYIMSLTEGNIEPYQENGIFKMENLVGTKVILNLRVGEYIEITEIKPDNG